MFQKVIYKRQYNKPTIEEIEAEIADEPVPAEVKEPAPSKDKCSSKDIFKQLNEGAVYVPLPERKPIAKAFISQAIEMSSAYWITLFKKPIAPPQSNENITVTVPAPCLISVSIW